MKLVRNFHQLSIAMISVILDLVHPAPPQRMMGGSTRLMIPYVMMDGRHCQPEVTGDLTHCDIALGDVDLFMKKTLTEMKHVVKCLAMFDSLYALCHLRVKFRKVTVPNSANFCLEMSSVYPDIHHSLGDITSWATLAKSVLLDADKCATVCISNSGIDDTCRSIWMAHYLLKNQIDQSPASTEAPSQMPVEIQPTIQPPESSESLEKVATLQPPESFEYLEKVATPQPEKLTVNLKKVAIPTHLIHQSTYQSDSTATSDQALNLYIWVPSLVCILSFLITLIVGFAMKMRSKTSGESNEHSPLSNSQLCQLLKIH